MCRFLEHETNTQQEEPTKTDIKLSSQVILIFNFFLLQLFYCKVTSTVDFEINFPNSCKEFYVGTGSMDSTSNNDKQTDASPSLNSKFSIFQEYSRGKCNICRENLITERYSIFQQVKSSLARPRHPMIILQSTYLVIYKKSEKLSLSPDSVLCLYRKVSHEFYMGNERVTKS